MGKYIGKYIPVCLLASLFLLNACGFAWAKEIKIVFTGQANAMLYPCKCPREPDGGVARRAALFKNLRAASGDVIFVEAGSSFASGPQDQYSQGSEADRRRTEVYLAALGLMGYDALLVGSQEYSFGQEFLSQQKGLPFVTSNVEGYHRPYVIKDLGWIKVGILGLTDVIETMKGISGLQRASSVSLSRKVSELKKRGAGLVILLSNLTQEEDLNITNSVSGIDVVINGTPSYGSVNLLEANSAIHIKTWWQARRVGVLTLDVSRGVVTKKNLEAIRLSSDIPDDEAVGGIVPQCFSDSDCKMIPGLVARCENPAAKDARCTYITPARVSLTVVKPRICRTCRVDGVLSGLQKGLGDMSVHYLFEDEPQAQSIIKQFGLTMLPAYVFPKDFERSEYFPSFKHALIKGPGYYLIRPENAGVSYILGRKRVPKKLDVIFGFDKASSPELFKSLKALKQKHKDVDIRLHFLAIPDKDKKGNFLTRGGSMPELEELYRIGCMDMNYPKKVFDYLICRFQQKGAGRWDECLAGLGANASKIAACAIGPKGRQSMASHTNLTENLKIASGPTFVIDNAEIFSIINIPAIEEFEKLIFSADEKEKKE